MYADDVVMFVSPAGRDLSFVRHALESFGGASALCTNFGKCSISPIRCTPEHLAVATAHFPCAVKLFPYTYLGMPLSYKRLAKASCSPSSTLSAAGYCRGKLPSTHQPDA